MSLETAGIHLARHGETEYNRLGRFQGWLPVPLNDLGRRQSAELAERAAEHGFAQLWSSPLQRARETAVIVGGRLGLHPVVKDEFAETDAGDWTDRTFADVQASDPDGFAAFVNGDPGFAFPGGESFQAHADRVMAGLEQARSAPRPLLIVCHGVVIRLALRRLHLDLHEGAAPGARLANAGMVELVGGNPAATAYDRARRGPGVGVEK